MNLLVGTIRNSLTELELGISGESLTDLVRPHRLAVCPGSRGALNVTEGMEALSTSLQLNRVNDTW